ncbi:hypothetical protein SESBI_07099 [Sesbania bispinosa]|nr:hypothetical protein SESBI_07099 [Sesbania bispinosa]
MKRDHHQDSCSGGAASADESGKAVSVDETEKMREEEQQCRCRHGQRNGRAAGGVGDILATNNGIGSGSQF